LVTFQREVFFSDGGGAFDADEGVMALESVFSTEGETEAGGGTRNVDGRGRVSGMKGVSSKG
jgi:hypothetical protein